MNILGILGGLFGAAGSIYQGNAARQAARANAAALEEGAGTRLQIMQADVDQANIRNRLVQGQSVANAAGSGLQIEGSPLEALAFAAGQQAREVEMLRIQGKLDARDMRRRAAIERAGGQAAQTAGFIGAGTALLGSAGSWGG